MYFLLMRCYCPDYDAPAEMYPPETIWISGEDDVAKLLEDYNLGHSTDKEQNAERIQAVFMWCLEADVGDTLALDSDATLVKLSEERDQDPHEPKHSTLTTQTVTRVIVRVTSTEAPKKKVRKKR